MCTSIHLLWLVHSSHVSLEKFDVLTVYILVVRKAMAPVIDKLRMFARMSFQLLLRERSQLSKTV